MVLKGRLHEILLAFLAFPLLYEYLPMIAPAVLRCIRPECWSGGGHLRQENIPL